MDSATRFVKRLVRYRDDSVSTVSARDFVRPYGTNPRRSIQEYLLSLFPILTWISRYNPTWALGDLISGLTVGMVLVPQGMSYAQIATLPTQYGLYSSFVGVTIYCLFATSKDVSIGPVAVASLLTSQIISKIQHAHPGAWAGPEIATTIAFISGFIVLGVGLLRLGWIIEFIPAPAVSGFMTGSALSITAGQLPGLMGITGFKSVSPPTRAATYHVIINVLKGLPRTTLDAAWGLPSLAALYIIQYTCDRLAKRFPRHARLFFFLSVMRNAFVILVMTIAAWLYCRDRRSSHGLYPINILLTVPRGFQHIGPPTIDPSLVKALVGQLPVATIVLLLEHIAISKSFGRLNGYTINPNQELIAIGVTNTVGSVFGAYPATGSFSRSALKAKSGVRTPLAGLATSLVVVVALYGLTPAFFWIPNATLAAVIISAVINLVASPAQVYTYWRVNPFEFVIWFAAVLVTVFSSVENGIYVSICLSVALLVIRIAHPRNKFLGKVTVRNSGLDNKDSREVFFPLNGSGATDVDIKVEPPAPGVIVYRFEESTVFLNAAILNSEIVSHVKANMRRGKDLSNLAPGDRPWNDPGPKNGAEAEQQQNLQRPELRAVVIDFSAVSHIDITAVQSLIDTRNEVERWADHPVDFHFSSILSPWIRRALIAGGFGMGQPSANAHREIARVVPGPERDNGHDLATGDLESQPNDKSGFSPEGFAPVIESETPFFHIDLAAAVCAAESGLS
ncbi:unnamed protein product [Mycena citricolor]|uniref:STAS domain-containing protein n=1 Tax=Mycena citricolor TaxID=2018698 RepID=A0AAD2GZ72_9AGAR|nr:unnamed protein product [Mycena citricolor]